MQSQPQLRDKWRSLWFLRVRHGCVTVSLLSAVVVRYTRLQLATRKTYLLEFQNECEILWLISFRLLASNM